MRGTRGMLFMLLIFSSLTVRAQYFSNGVDPFSTRWTESRTDRYRLVYPLGSGSDARRVAAVLDTAYAALHTGFSRPALRLPVILRTQNLLSNGVVVWTPRRAELIVAPPTESFATPWLKQLTVHEYRHVVQMSNLDRGVIKGLSYLLGEQALGASAAFLPKWFLEGDAVLAETSMASHGRALQPDFTLVYRALLAEGEVDRFSVDKWFLGSFGDVLPDHYHYGYQMVNHSYKKYGPEIWENLFDYVARRPYRILPRQIALKKFYGTSSAQLFRESFGALKAKWDALPPVAETMRIVPTPVDTYTAYSHPVTAPDGTIVAHRSDLERPGRLVAVDPAGSERVLTWTGPLSSRPVIAGEELYWTEYQPSTFWEQRNRSVVRRLPLDGSSRARTVPLPGNFFYVTPLAEGFSAVAYDPVEKYALVIFDADFQEIDRIKIPSEQSVHGLAWDEATATLALITLGERGMAFTGVQPRSGEFFAITEPSFVSINHLRAGGGRLYFNSTASGRDESHAYDLRERKEYRLSTSRFGSVMPAVDAAGETLVQASYRREGYLLSTQKPRYEVLPTNAPVDLFNLPVADLGMPNLDAMTLFPQADARELPAKRYRRAAHTLHLHSWAPVSFDPLKAANDRNIDLHVGVTAMIQSELSDAEGFLTYGRVNGTNWFRGGLRWLAMAPKFELTAEYGGGPRSVIRSDEQIPLPAGWDEQYFTAEGRAYLPISLSSGAMLRSLTPSISLEHHNTMFYLPDTERFTKEYQQSEVSLSYVQTARMAVRDLAPRRGFGLQATWAAAPFDDAFGSLWSFSGNLYLPGVARNHSLGLRGAYQTQSEATWHFGSNVLFPRGVPYDFAPRELTAAAADYRFPLACPDAGIDGWIYIKRLSLDLFGGYARYEPFSVRPTGWHEAYSYGAELSIDFHPLRMANMLTLRAALYRSSVSDPVDVSLGLSFNL